MTKRRTAIPVAVQKQVLKDFNHRCAVCGADRPQLHHIDENPSNSEPLNIIPLCPNCHLTDQHDASNAIPYAKLRFFRRYKHRHILKPQFNPVFRRMEFLNHVMDEESAGSLQERAYELIALIRNLPMGNFYGDELDKRLVMSERFSFFVVGDPVSEAQDDTERRKAEVQYREQLRRSVPDIERLIVEMLDYQTWPEVRD